MLQYNWQLWLAFPSVDYAAYGVGAQLYATSFLPFKCDKYSAVSVIISLAMFGWLGCTSPPRRIGHQMFWGCVILLLANFGQRPLS